MNTKKEDHQFYCDVCDCELKDSANYLDHINGKRHNRNKGINLKQFKDSTFEEVKAMLEKKRQERDQRLSDRDKAPELIRDVPGEHEDYDGDDDDEDEYGDDYDEETGDYVNEDQ